MSNPLSTPLNGYIGFYGDRRIEIYAGSLYDAKQHALEVFKPSKKNKWKVHVVLAEVTGMPVFHSTASL